MRSMRASTKNTDRQERCSSDYYVYQAFRWWGVGTRIIYDNVADMSLSSVPVVGCRNQGHGAGGRRHESIKRSGGGVSEPSYMLVPPYDRSLSSVPVVGCRNSRAQSSRTCLESIKRSGGGVSELGCAPGAPAAGVYQAFRWWGVGTCSKAARLTSKSLSSVPVVGCRNSSSRTTFT